MLLFCRRPVATPAEVGAATGAFFLQGFITGGRTLSLSSPAAAASCKVQGARAEVSLMVELLRQSNRVELHGGDDLIVICFLLLLFC